MKEKVFKLNFGDSAEDIKLYNWLITHENMDDFVKEILTKEMNTDLDYVTVSRDDLKEMKEKIANFLGDRFKSDDDKVMVSIDDINEYYK